MYRIDAKSEDFERLLLNYTKHYTSFAWMLQILVEGFKHFTLVRVDNFKYTRQLWNTLSLKT